MRPRTSEHKMDQAIAENTEINRNDDFENNNRKLNYAPKIVPVFQNRVGNVLVKETSENKLNEMSRIPKVDDIDKEIGKDLFINQKHSEETNYANQNILDRKSTMSFGKLVRRPSYSLYKNFGVTESALRRSRKDQRFYSYCIMSVCCSFLLGLIIGIVLMGSSQTRAYNPSLRTRILRNDSLISTRTLNSLKLDTNVESVIIDTKHGREDKLHRFTAVSFNENHASKKLHFTSLDKKDVYPKGLTEDMKEILKDNKMANHKLDKHSIITKNTNKIVNFVPNDMTVLYENVFWGPEVENSMPQGYGASSADIWERYVNHSEVAKMESGCGRMQNRLVTFKDGIQACVRYRQNTDQIQGEIFSFYVAKLLNLTNVAPSVVKVVDVKDKLWNNVAADINTAQWNSNRAVVLTQYIPSLESAKIPDVFKPANRHLNKNDVLEISMKENVDTENSKKILIEKLKPKQMKINKENTSKSFNHIDMKLNKKTIDLFVELAQWSDLIIFDYLTANLDRIVNNLFNFQWNINIMDGPAHNLARKMDSGLLLFLDNESGLLHGYRLLKKYNVYHSLMLDNLCVFRKTTVDALKTLHTESVGKILSDKFHEKNNAVIRDILPPLPEKNAKILHERIGKVLSQIEKCQRMFSNR